MSHAERPAEQARQALATEERAWLERQLHRYRNLLQYLHDH